MTKINLDRSYKLDITYPLGVNETITFTNNDEVTLTDDYEIVIATQRGVVFETIPDDAVKLTKVDNKLIWVINYEYLSIQLCTYNYEVRNKTQDWIEFRGAFTVTKTIN